MSRFICIIALITCACVEERDSSMDRDESMLNQADEQTPFQFAVYGIDLVARGGSNEFEGVSIYLSTAAPGADACTRPTEGISVSIAPSSKLGKEPTTVNATVSGRDESKPIETLTGVVELKAETSLESKIVCALAVDGCKDGEAPPISGSLRIEEADMIVMAGSFEAIHCSSLDTLTFEEGPGFFEDR